MLKGILRNFAYCFECCFKYCVVFFLFFSFSSVFTTTFFTAYGQDSSDLKKRDLKKSDVKDIQGSDRQANSYALARSIISFLGTDQSIQFSNEQKKSILQQINELFNKGFDPDYTLPELTKPGRSSESIWFLLWKSADLAPLGVRLLQMYPEKINQQDSFGRSILMYVLSNSHFRLARLLIQKNADSNLKDANGRSVFHHLLGAPFILRGITSSAPFLVLQRVRDVLDQGDESSAQYDLVKDVADRTELFLTLLGKSDSYLAPRVQAGEESAEILKQLASDDSLLDRDRAEVTPLMLAASSFSINVLDLILNRMPENKRINYINQSDMDGRSALHYAVLGGNEAVVGWLIAQGADVNANKVSQSPLSAAVLSHNTAVVSTLILAGADKYALFESSSSTYNHLANILRADSAAILPFFSDVEADWTTRNAYSGETLLHHAIKNNCPVAGLRFAIEKGANPDTADFHGDLPIMLAAKKLDLLSFEMLLPKTDRLEHRNVDDENLEGILGSVPTSSVAKTMKNLLHNTLQAREKARRKGK